MAMQEPTLVDLVDTLEQCALVSSRNGGEDAVRESCKQAVGALIRHVEVRRGKSTLLPFIQAIEEFQRVCWGYAAVEASGREDGETAASVLSAARQKIFETAVQVSPL